MGPTLLVSPLLSLMRNQIAAAERMGVIAETINSDNQQRWREVEDAIGRDAVDILLISPERLANERFREEVLARIAAKVALLVIDEAHCISDWGHDFRPHYRLIQRIIQVLPPNLRLLATTATANNRVMADLRDILGQDVQISRGDLARPSLALQTIRLPGQAERLAWLAEQLPTLPGSGIVYTLTVRDAEMVARWLKSQGINVEAYTSNTGDRRPELEQALLDNRVKALVATTALGMGFDKPDLAFVIHYHAPGSVVAYYQQVGRAGRALDEAYGILLIRDAEMVARWLKSQGINVEAYTSNTGDRRPELEQALLDNRVKALVATTALGMGFDKPDLAFVIHYHAPGSVVAYYQQVGRAGRALDEAYGILLSGTEETEITDYFIESAFPTRSQVEIVLRALEEAPEGLSLREFEAAPKVNLSNGCIQKTIQLLSLESPSPIAKLDTKWQLTAAILGESFWDRAQRLTELRRAEQEQMQNYAELSSGHMAFLIDALDGEPGDFTPPDLPDLPTSVDPQRVRDAVVFLRRTSMSIEPRRRWPPGNAIAVNHQLQPGKALCVWGDAGWGYLVRQGKYRDDYFSDELVTACIHLVEEWRPDPFPQWVTAIPSHRQPELVLDFAQRLAAKLQIPFIKAIVTNENRPEQKTMENSDKQARNAFAALDVNQHKVLSSPVLLVDDMVDSRWTFTVAAYKLRQSGSGEVFPLALSYAGGT